MDLREEFLSNVSYDLMVNFKNEDVTRIREIIVRELSRYDLSMRTGDLAIYSDTNERIIDMYCCSLSMEGKSPKTVEVYKNVLRRYAVMIHKPVIKSVAYDVREWLTYEQKSVSLRTCETYRAYLSAFYKWLEREEMIEKNPMNKIKPIKYHKENKKAFTEIEIDKMRSACTTLRERAIIEMLLSSGARVSELCAIDKSDIDLVGCSLIIRNGKGGKERKTFFGLLAREHLKKYIDSRKDNNEALFITKLGTRITDSSVENELKKIGKTAGVDNVHPHRFRRTFATTFVHNGMDINSVRLLMGHENINTTTNYVAVDEEQIKNEYRRYA